MGEWRPGGIIFKSKIYDADHNSVPTVLQYTSTVRKTVRGVRSRCLPERSLFRLIFFSRLRSLKNLPPERIERFKLVYDYENGISIENTFSVIAMSVEGAPRRN